MNSRTTLYLAQSYRDSWEDYKRSLNHYNLFCWDYVILTASNEQQAEGYRIQIKERQSKGLLPESTHYAVLADRNDVRVGSGGATLDVIRYIALHSGKTDFSGLRILTIHSGGDSKRVPQYSALGKLFSPVPRKLPDGRASTLFDEFMVSMASLATRVREGMVVLSGDVLLLFNPLLVDFPEYGAAAISFKEDASIGINHGVFLRGENGNVKAFLHKQSIDVLKRLGAVNESGAVDIDTGMVYFSKEVLVSLFNLVSTQEGYFKYVNDVVRLSLYGDFLYPLATDSSLEEFYNEKPEGEYCHELMDARTAVWNCLCAYNLKLVRVAPAKFIHFGTTREILTLMSKGISLYHDLEWKRHVNSSVSNDQIAGYCSVLSDGARIGDNCYLESSYIHRGAVIGENTILSHIDVHNEVIPSDIVLHGLKLRDGKFVVRIYGIDDDPKKELESGCTFLGNSLESFMKTNCVSIDELWDGKKHMLWNAKIYPACSTIHEALAAALDLYKLVQGKSDIYSWRFSRRESLYSSFDFADPYALVAWQKRMSELVDMDNLYELIRNRKNVEEGKEVLCASDLTPIQQEWLDKRLSQANYSEAMRLFYYIGNAIGGAKGEHYISACFKTIQKTILENSLHKIKFHEDICMIKDRHTVRLPLRVNWGGGWSDTPPYCNEKGGTVLNAAIALNGELPVEVTLKRIVERKIVFDSRDMDIHGEFTKIESLQTTGDPYDPFALQKAALLVCGVIPREGGDLDKILTRLGGGFYMQTEVTGVPKGSGLGTSSILAAACMKGLLEFFGIKYLENDVYNYVLCMEQIMSTGGGWQDQIGGLTMGIKYITSAPGLTQQMQVNRLKLTCETHKRLNDRFALVYTGQRRLARNLLRDVVGRYIGNTSDSLYALNEIQRIAALMRFELERGRIDDFAELMNKHWELLKMIDAGSTNTLIDQIFDSISDLISGRMICGAGGGGFLQIIMKEGVTKDRVHDCLKSVFQDSDIDVWDCTIL